MPRTNLALVRPAAPSPPEPPKPSAKHPKFSYYVTAVRNMWTATSENEVKVLGLIRDFERATVCWKTSPDTKFEDILREEKLCPIGRYRAFKRASDSMPRDQIKLLGLDAVCLIAKQPQKNWPRLMRLAGDHRKRFGHPPNTAQTTVMVNMVVQRESKRPTYSQLRQYNETLQAVIREHNLKAPRMPEKGV